MTQKTSYEKMGDYLTGRGCGIAALVCAERQDMCKQKGEKDTEFVKRIAIEYNRAVFKIHFLTIYK